MAASQSALDCIAAADALLASQIPMNVKTNTALGQQMVSIADCLDQFNPEFLIPGCVPAMRMEENETSVETQFQPHKYSKPHHLLYRRPLPIALRNQRDD